MLWRKCKERLLCLGVEGVAVHWCQLNVSLAVETAATRNFTCLEQVTFREGFAYKNLDFSLARAGGLGFCSTEFHSPGLKLTPMIDV